MERFFISAISGFFAFMAFMFCLVWLKVYINDKNFIKNHKTSLGIIYGYKYDSTSVGDGQLPYNRAMVKIDDLGDEIIVTQSDSRLSPGTIVKVHYNSSKFLGITFYRAYIAPQDEVISNLKFKHHNYIFAFIVAIFLLASYGISNI